MHRPTRSRHGAFMAFVAFFLTLLGFAAMVVSAEELDCTVKHPSTGKYYDLNPLTRKDSSQDWTPDADHSAMDFKLNVCHALQSKELDVKYPEDIASWGKKTKGTSLGKLSKRPFFRGDSLLLEYVDGDDCPNTNGNYKKSTLIRFICDNSVSGQGNPFLMSNSNDCSFWFEWRTPAACPAVPHASSNSGGVFGTIIGVVLFVYLAGGIAYNRIVHHARGLKQIPNYHWWAEAFDFIKDMVLILVAKCYRPKRSQTYHNLPVDAEINTLIDQDYEDDEV